MAYQATSTIYDVRAIKEQAQQLKHALNQVEQVQSSFRKMGIQDIGAYVENRVQEEREAQRRESEQSDLRYLLVPKTCPTCGKTKCPHCGE